MRAHAERLDVQPASDFRNPPGQPEARIHARRGARPAVAEAARGAFGQLLETLTRWRRGIQTAGLVLMVLSIFLVWESAYGHGYLSGESWSYGVPVHEETRGFAHPAGLLTVVLLGALVGTGRLMRRRSARAREAVSIGLAALAWLVALAGAGGTTSYTPGGVEMTTVRAEGATMAAWGAFLFLFASILAYRAQRA